MRLKTKKFIAREFLILFSCGILGLLAFAGTYIYNLRIDSSVKELKASKASLEEKADGLERPFRNKVNAQKSFFLISERNRWHTENLHYTQLWKKLEKLKITDSLDYRWKNKFNAQFKEELRSDAGLANRDEFRTFLIENSLSSDEQKQWEQVESLRTKAKDDNIKAIETSFLKMKDNEQLGFGLKSFFWMFIIAFPLRYLFFAIMWSFKTLRSEE